MKILHLTCRFFAVLAFSWFCSVSTFAQDQQIESSFRRVSPQEAQRLEAVLASPVPQGASTEMLDKHFVEKESAAQLLGERTKREDTLRVWAATSRSWIPRLNLAFAHQYRQEYALTNQWMREACDLASNNWSKSYCTATFAEMLAQQYQTTAAEKVANDARALIATSEPTARLNWQLVLLARAKYRLSMTTSTLQRNAGQWEKALASAKDAEKDARRGVQAAVNDSKPNKLSTAVDISDATGRITAILRDMGQFNEAELSLASHLRLARELELPALQRQAIYESAANLRYVEREFSAAEKLVRSADQMSADMGYDALHPWRIAKSRLLMMALGGQKRWVDAATELSRIDALATLPTQQARVKMGYERGLVYLHTGRAAEAAPLFQSIAQYNRKTFGDAHMFTANALGLQGAALWRGGKEQDKPQALALLKQSMRDQQLPVNADFSENHGLRKEIRTLIFSAYLEAVATTPGENGADALGIADWVRGGVVQGALADAAVRSAAADPGLADLVRQDQDAKNEVAALRSYLSGEAGGFASPLPEIATKMRERIALVEQARSLLHAKIKLQFPDYDRLVRPIAPTAADVSKGLEADEALIMLLPTDDAVYVWATSADTTPVFARVAIRQDDLNKAVAALRQTLQIVKTKEGKRLPNFNADLSYKLYHQLLNPVSKAWTNKTRLVVAAGGALGQIPFGLLLTEPGRGAASGPPPQWPWLIKQLSITHVPSVTAWLATKQFAKSQAAPEVLMAWGDPIFSLNASAAKPEPSRAVVNSVAGTAQDDVWVRDLEINRQDRDSALDLETDSPAGSTDAAQAAMRARPAYGDVLSRLVDTAAELREIARSLQANPETDLRLGLEATRDSVLQSNKSGELRRKRVVAFSTHGIKAGDIPGLNQPALALAVTSNTEKNWSSSLLVLQDVLGLKLNADWVVLSACNTAASDGLAEEALSGLARGFFYAGSRSLVVTHWSVESVSAKELMVATFDHYTRNPQAPKAESLRQAMLKVMNMPRYSHPFFWAPYALVGDGGR